MASKPNRNLKSVIPYGCHLIDENDIQTVINVLRSDFITQGPLIDKFEKQLANYCGAKYAVAVNSGTSALHIACLAAGVTEGDEVITSPNTFVASANCVVYCRGTPIFADIDNETYNISPLEIEKNISNKTKAIIPVHFAGQSCEMDFISTIAGAAEKKIGHKIYIIEDACHALGSSFKGQLVGACKYSDMAVMSFHPVKHITTGEGGAVLTNDEALYKKLRRFRSHGITKNPEEFLSKELAFSDPKSQDENCGFANPWYYEQQDLGYNYRITDIQCALGLSQLHKLDQFRERRRKLVNIYNEAFDKVRYIKTPFESKKCVTNFHLYLLLIDFAGVGISRKKTMNDLRDRGIQTQVHYIPVHLQPFYQKNFGTKWGDCPNAEDYYQKCLSIPLQPTLVDSDVQKIIKALMDCMPSAKR